MGGRESVVDGLPSRKKQRGTNPIYTNALHQHFKAFAGFLSFRLVLWPAPFPKDCGRTRLLPGASSYLAMLAIAGFLGATWTASKVSRSGLRWAELGGWFLVFFLKGKEGLVKESKDLHLVQEVFFKVFIFLALKRKEMRKRAKAFQV